MCSLLIMLSIAPAINAEATKNSRVESKTSHLKPEKNTADSVAVLINGLTLEQKLGQLQQIPCPAKSVAEIPESLKVAIRQGTVGSILNAVTPEIAETLQHIAMEESATKIPLVFARDVIHGYRTIMPIPLGQAASWNPELVKQGAEIAAREASSVGIRWTFAPMLDISRDARWGRIAESFGEDPYLVSTLGVASIQGYQGNDLSKPYNIASTVKHFLGYGTGEGGRDYESTYIPEPLLHEVYLAPFAAATRAGTAGVMSAFSQLNGIPASVSTPLLDGILRKELGFDGIIISDWGSLAESTIHGYAATKQEETLQGTTAGVDVEMATTNFHDYLPELIRDGKVDMASIDRKVARVLKLKQQLGLFEKPYIQGDAKTTLLTPASLAASQTMASQSLVLLKNDKKLLPLNPQQKIALIGPLADANHEQMGTWVLDGQKQDTVTVLAAMKQAVAKAQNLSFSSGLPFSRSTDTKDFKQAIQLAKKSDVIVFVGGEESVLSGEAHSRADIRLPGAQEALIHELKKTGKPLVLVIMAGRPIALNDVIDDLDAVIMAWHPGTMGGPATADVLFGKVSPSGRLPVTWPKVTGQLPLYYNHANTGRPADKDNYINMKDYPVEVWQHATGHNTSYIDAGYEPQFPFGFGLSYSEVEYSDLKLDKTSIKADGQITVSARITNKGERSTAEVVQLYLRDQAASSIRPIRELKGFQRVKLAANSSQTVTFTLTDNDLAFFNQKLQRVVEPGDFTVWVAPNSASGIKAQFTVTP